MSGDSFPMAARLGLALLAFGVGAGVAHADSYLLFPAKGRSITTPEHTVGCGVSTTRDGVGLVTCVADRQGQAARYALGISAYSVMIFAVRRDGHLERTVRTFWHRTTASISAGSGRVVSTFPVAGKRVYLTDTDVSCRYALLRGREIVNCDVSRPGVTYAYAISSEDAIVFRYTGRNARPEVVLHRVQN